MRLAQVTFIYQEKQDNIYQEVGLGADYAEIAEDGYVNLDDVQACSAFYEYTNIFMNGGANFTIEMELHKFVELWIS